MNFGVIPRNSATQYKTISLMRADGGPISPEMKPIRTSGLHAQVCEIEAGDRYDLEISIGPPWPQGPFKEMLTIKTGVEQAKEVTLYVTGDVAQRLTAAPTRVVLPFERPEKTEQTVALNWEDGPPGKILEATSTIPDATVRVDEKDGKQTLVLTVPPGSGRIPGRHSVTLRTDDQDVPSYSIPITFREMRVSPRGKASTAATLRSTSSTPQKPIRVMPAGTGKKE